MTFYYILYNSIEYDFIYSHFHCLPVDIILQDFSLRTNPKHFAKKIVFCHDTVKKPNMVQKGNSECNLYSMASQKLIVLLAHVFLEGSCAYSTNLELIQSVSVYLIRYPTATNVLNRDQYNNTLIMAFS